jgi:hypothetical protein
MRLTIKKIWKDWILFLFTGEKVIIRVNKLQGNMFMESVRI